MHRPAKQNDATSADQPGLLAPDTSGMNFYRADPALTDLLRIHLPDALFRHIEPHLDRLGALAGGHLDECARLADRHVPALHQRRQIEVPRWIAADELQRRLISRCRQVANVVGSFVRTIRTVIRADRAPAA